MSVEEELKNPELFVISALIGELGDADLHDYTPERMIGAWKVQVDLLNSPPWANGSHEGDCTQIPATCYRCYVETIVQEAKQLIELVKSNV